MPAFKFKNAEKVAEKPTAAKKSAKPVIEMRHIKKIGALDWLITAASTVKDVFVTELKQDIVEHFVQIGTQIKSKPENFTGEEDGHTASCQLRKRSSRSVLTDEEVALCEEHNIPVGKEDVTVQTFIFNPAYLGDAALMAKIEKALSGIPGLPSDIILEQEGKQVSVVTDESVAAAFKLTPEACATVLPVLTTPAVSPKFEVVGGNFAPVMAEIASIMSMPELKDVIASAKKKAA